TRCRRARARQGGRKPGGTRRLRGSPRRTVLAQGETWPQRRNTNAEGLFGPSARTSVLRGSEQLRRPPPPLQEARRARGEAGGRGEPPGMKSFYGGGEREDAVYVEPARFCLGKPTDAAVRGLRGGVGGVRGDGVPLRFPAIPARRAGRCLIRIPPSPLPSSG